MTIWQAVKMTAVLLLLNLGMYGCAVEIIEHLGATK